MNAFRQTLDQSGDADLVDHLGELARACGPEPLHIRDRPLSPARALARRLRSPAHDRQDTVFRAGLAAETRRIDELEASFVAAASARAGDLGGCGGVIDEGRRLSSCRECTVGAKRNRPRSLSLPTQAMTKS